MFVDRMKQSGSWTTPTEAVTFDSNGYPLEVTTVGQQMNKYLFQNMQNIYPAGNYTLSWKGTGTIWVRSPAVCTDLPDNQCVISGTDVTRIIPIPEGNSLIQFKIMASDLNDHITELHFIMPGFESTYETNPVHPDYVAGLAEFDFIRVMDPLHTNHAENVFEWSDRIPTTYNTYASDGVAWEDLFYIVNQNDQDIWINIPHAATDNYVTNLVALINFELEPGRHIYVEYSNEIWNSIFTQYPYARDKGREAFGTETAAADAVAWWNARRSAQIWQIFADNLIGGRTITRVASGQGVNSYRAQQVLLALADPVKNPTSQRADAIAIAYYFGAGSIDTWLTQNDTIPRANVTIANVEDMMNHLPELLDLGEASIYGAREQGMIDHATLAATHGVRVIGYEGGQSYYIGTGYDQLVKAATLPITEALSNHSRMRDLYNQFLTVFFSNGGKEFANFSYINAPQSSGAWGIYDYSGDTEGLYKLAGLRDMMSYGIDSVTPPSAPANLSVL